MDDGMATGIMLAMICILAVPVSLFGAIGYLVFRQKKGWGWLGALLGVGLGVLLGVVGVGFTFYEDTMSPPPHIEIDVPEGFAHEWVFFLEDPTSSTEITWGGLWSPSARISVPRSGVVRVRALGQLDGGNTQATLSDGRPHNGFSGLNLPAALGGGRMVAYCFVGWPGREPDVSTMDEATLTARITELEAER